MRPRFQADGDFNHKIVIGLRRLEPAVDFRTAREGGMIGLSDPEVLRIAANSSHILVSHDRKTMLGHFSRFIKGSASAGVVIVPQDLDIGAAIEDLLLIWAATDAEEWIDRIGYLPV